MQGRGLYWISTVLAGASIALVIVNGTMYLGNQSVQAEVNRRQQFINQSVQLSRVSEALVRSILGAATRNKDEQLRKLLAQHGISADGVAPDAAPAAPSSGVKK